MDVEVLAVGKIQNMIARCPHLKPVIAMNDKTAFTDGHIELYSGLSHKKENWLGRVSVQVKGRTFARKRSEIQSFAVTRVDLQGFQRDGGVLYFVVQIDSKSGKQTPYYALLSPFTIEHYLLSVPEGQKSVSVRLNRFPNEPASIESIVHLAFRTRQQNTSIGFDPVLFKSMESITVYTASELDWNSPIWLSPDANDFALVLHTSGGLSLPLGGALWIGPTEYNVQSIDISIRSGSYGYRKATVRRIDEEHIEIQLSEGLTLVLADLVVRQSVQVKLQIVGDLTTRLNDLEFFLDVFKTGQIEIDGIVSPLGRITRDVVREVGDLEKYLGFLRILGELFIALGVNEELVDLSDIDEEQVRNLRTLHRAIVADHELSEGERSRILVRLGAWNLMLVVVPGNDTDRWRFIDPFNPLAPHLFRASANDESSNESYPITAYDIVEEPHLSTLLNLRLESIVEAYAAIADSSETFGLANQQVLALIRAADSCTAREDEFLSAANALNKWLLSEQGGLPHHAINDWQIRWRSGSLAADDWIAIRDLKRKSAQSRDEDAEELELACALLLGAPDEISYLTTRMSKDKTEVMKSWPIWTLQP